MVEASTWECRHFVGVVREEVRGGACQHIIWRGLTATTSVGPLRGLRGPHAQRKHPSRGRTLGFIRCQAFIVIRPGRFLGWHAGMALHGTSAPSTQGLPYNGYV